VNGAPPNLATVELKAFVPARDFERSKAFYQALGFVTPWSDDDLAYFHAGSVAFLLQRFHVEQHSENFVMHLLVENVDDWHRHVLSLDLPGRFGARVGALKDQPWAMRDFPLHDPSGVLWLIAQNIDRTAPAAPST
jgi:catechol 2,3-dioxygenase-like lactoylglutathione lyase family enzyme